MSVLPLLYQLKKGKIIYIFNLLKSVLLLLVLLCGRRVVATVGCLVPPCLLLGIGHPAACCWVLVPPLLAVGYWPLALRREDVFLTLSRKYSSSLAY